MSALAPSLPPLWLVCEDGAEYALRFTRFLGREFRFRGVPDGNALLAALAEQEAAGDAATGLLLDLDFRRTPVADLLDEQGRCAPTRTDEERRRLAERQGILVLQHARAHGVGLPALLFADLDDDQAAAWLEQTLAPLAVVPGHESIVDIAARMRRAR